ncbi:InlB B-repeat-containing protein, partial [Candidatus Saccharibacteria bacterium]|nr:InlB B-repeat-containing protein [Candidatus Saccharibacteria bacterium]
MFSGGIPVTSRAEKRKTKREKNNKLVRILVATFLGVFVSVFAFNSLAEVIESNDARVDVDSELTYYLNVKEEGVDASGIESSDSQIADVRGGRINVTDKLPEGLIFQGFVTTSDGTIGAVSRADSSIQCPGKVVDDTNEEALDTGTWNNTHTEYYYHGLHYNDTTRTVSFTAEKIKAGCQLTVGIITKTPATIDDPDTTPVEIRRDFYNTAFAAEKDITAISNTVHAWIGSSNTRVYKVMYRYTGDIPTGAPTTPTEQSYPANNEVAVSMNPTLEGYTFSGWTTTDATVTDGSFTMPSQDVELVGIWTKNTTSTKYNVTYVINGDKPADFMPPTQKEYEAEVSVPLDSTEADTVIDGYRFSGWSTQDVALSDTGFTMPAQNVTIVGSFERISYRVCYEFEGAILPPNSASILPPCETHYPGETVTRAADPQADGYDFLGWYKNASFTMPEENVTIYGEWMRTMGKFAPTIAKTITNPQDEYMYGETVKFKITVTNPESFAITDVYLQEELDGAVFTAPNDSSYTVKTSTIAVIPIVNANSSIDVYAEYRVTEN